MSIRKKKTFSCMLATAMFLFTCFTAHAQTESKTLFEEGISKYKEGKYQDAVDIFSKLIMENPENASAYKNRGVALLNLGNPDFAIKDFTLAIDLEPDMRGIYSNLGAAWHYKGEYVKAIDSYNMAIKEEPLREIFYYNRGISKVAADDLAGAIADLEKAIDLNSKLEAAIYARQAAMKKKAETEGITFTVQIGAFRNKKYALKNQAALIKKGFDAKLIPFFDDRKKLWYLVRCGSGLSREEANQLGKKLKDDNGFDTFVCPEHTL